MQVTIPLGNIHFLTKTYQVDSCNIMNVTKTSVELRNQKSNIGRFNPNFKPMIFLPLPIA